MMNAAPTTTAAGPDSYASTPRSPAVAGAGLLSDDELTDLFQWIDAIPLSRPKKNFTRDFSDGCLCAEVIRHLHPRLVDLHNYPPANSTPQKIYNWNTLNFKVLKKLNCALTDDTIQHIVQCRPGIVETVLFDIKQKVRSPPPSPPHPPPLTTDQLLSIAPSTDRTAAGLSHAMSGASLPKAPAPLPQQSLPRGGVYAGTPSAAEWRAPAAVPAAAGLPPPPPQDVNRDQLIATLRETVGILQEKIHKLELLLVLKDKKIQELSR
ncbi:Sperm flagellar protein 1 [Allomyces javanicus]|nr:Sperm flagellar protein 1 [Allomyces javanicus]